MKTVDDLFKKAGGSVHVAAALNLNQWTVERWRQIGIPIFYWEVLKKKYGVTAEELLQMTKAARDK